MGNEISPETGDNSDDFEFEVHPLSWAGAGSRRWRRIAANAGQDGAVIVEAVRRAQKEKKDKNIGFNVLDNKTENMVEAGVIDAAKVTRSALENAASIAAMILTTEVLITDLPEKNPAQAVPSMPDY